MTVGSPEVWEVATAQIWHVAWPTIQQASLGLACGFLAAIVVHAVRSRAARVDLTYRPLIIIAYCVPTFALSMFAAAAGLPADLTWILVGLTLIIPLETALANGVAEADALDGRAVGAGWRRFWFVRAPAMIPSLLMGLSIGAPWALLGAMLIEVSEGNQGLGLRLATDAQLGFEAQAPLAAAAILVSAGAYAILRAAAAIIRDALGLSTTPARRAMLPPRNIEFGPVALGWGVLLTFLIWSLMHVRDDVPVGAPWDPEPLLRMMPSLPINWLQTLGSVTVSTAAGVAVGLAAVIVGLIWAWSRPVLDALLLPLQIIPLNVFALPLIMLTLLTAPPMTFDTPATLIVDWVSILVGTLATAYVTLQYLSVWLLLLPGRRSGLLASVAKGDPQVLRHVYLPWLSRGAGAFLPALLPRVLLAVLITEYLVTKRGLGGAIGAGRAERDFKGTFVLIMALVLTAFLLQTLVTSYVRWRNDPHGEARA